MEPLAEVNVIGIIKEMKFMEQTSRNKCKYSSTICDPLTGHEVDLLLYLNLNEKPPQRGAIGVLHNYSLFKQGTCRLNSTYKSYFREEKVFTDQLTSELRQFRDRNDWFNLSYKNLSGMNFLFRTIKELKNLMGNIDDKIYSYIEY
jgi:hypothetical protein